jgi:hypothetical protein
VDECTGGTLAAGVNGQSEGGALKIFFYKLTAFLKYPITFVFVLDGNDRPTYKRGHQLKFTTPWWKDYVCEMISYFGFHFHQVWTKLQKSYNFTVNFTNND